MERVFTEYNKRSLDFYRKDLLNKLIEVSYLKDNVTDNVL